MRDKWIATVGTLLAVAALVLLVAGASSPREELVTKEYLETRLQDYLTRADFDREKQLLATKEDLEEEIRRIDGELANKADQSTLDDLGKKVAVNGHAITVLDARLTGLGEKVAVNGQRITGLDAEIADNKVLVRLNREILDAISQKDGERYLPKILGNMDSTSFAVQMEDVVQRSIRDHCTVIITNNTGRTQGIRVNEGERTEIAPYGRAVFEGLRTGNVTTRLDGQKIVNWAVGPPYYTQDIQIVESTSAGTVWYVPY